MIYNTNNEFPFNNLYLSTPYILNEKVHFSKIKINNDNDVLVQFPKCISKNGIVKKNNSNYIDLVFDIYNEKLIKWINNINSIIKYLIFQKNKEWYENFITLETIDNNYLNFSKKYDENKVSIKILIDEKELKNMHCYDEKGCVKNVSDITSKTPIIPLLELCGIKITSSNFLLIFKMNQVLIMKEKNIKINNNIQIKKKEEVDSYSSSYESSDNSEYDNETDNSENNDDDDDDNDDDDDGDEGFNINDILEEEDDNVLNLNMLTNFSSDSSSDSSSSDDEDLENIGESLENNNKQQESQDLENNVQEEQPGQEEQPVQEEQPIQEEQSVQEEQPIQDSRDLENNKVQEELHNLENNELKDQQTQDLENINVQEELHDLETNKLLDQDMKSKNLKQNDTLEKTKLNTLENVNYLEEINISNIKCQDNDNISLKKPKNIYYDLYFKAKNIAENKKQESLRAYFELNQIKNILIENNY